VITNWLYRALTLVSLAGGGGSSSGGGGGGFSGGGSYSSSGNSGSGDPVVALIVIVVFIVACIFIAIQSRRLDRASGLSKDSQDNLSKDEISARGLFLTYQSDWSKNDIEAMKEYMTPKYHHRADLMIKALVQQGRRNEVLNVKPGMIKKQVNATDSHKFAVLFTEASATDNIIDIATDTVISSRSLIFSESWYFLRHGTGELLLDNIVPSTTAPKTLIFSMKEFAEENHLEYFLDWGTLTLPPRGVIFDKGSFDKSDINNYMVGEYNEQLIQMYSYTPNSNVQVNGKPYPIYLVGQIAVPDKKYGGIVVMKNKLIDRRPKGYKKYEMEWGDFNKTYDIFASDADKVTTFELLNPAFMAFLQDEVKLDLTLEVVDNMVYFYTKASTNSENYSILLEVLLRAFKEMKM